MIDQEKETITYEQKKEVLINRISNGDMVYSHSSFENFIISPLKFIQQKIQKTEPTPAMIFGSMVHCLILEPHVFDDQYYVLREVVKRNTIKGRARAEEIKEDAGKRQVITAKDYDDANMILQSLHASPIAQHLFEQMTEFEKKINWNYDDLPFVGYIDGFGEDVLIDLKVTNDCTPKKIGYKCRFDQYGIDGAYGRQAAHYTFGYGEEKQYYIIACQRNGDHSVTEVTEETRYRHADFIRKKIKTLKQCILSKSWDESYSFHSIDGVYRV